MDERFERLAEPFDSRNAYHDVRIGTREFTCVDAYHVLARLTKVFGLCGEGWGLEVAEWRESGSTVGAIGHLWYIGREGARCEVPAVGAARVVKGDTEEARKGAVTNLMSKAASYLGVGLSVYQGRGLDDPYLDRAGESVPPPPPPARDVATESDWQRVRESREVHGLSQEQVAAMMEEGPFCVGGNPRNLLRVHVDALVRRIVEAAENRPEPEGADVDGGEGEE